MKKLASILLIVAMLATMIPMAVVSASAEEQTVTLPTAGWNDEGNYDLSWCTVGTANASDSVKIGNTWYKFLNYPANTTFELSDAADLAGLSVITNAANASGRISGSDVRANPFFADVTFNIIADIDLSGKLWTPIATDYAGGSNSGTGTASFGGHLIGANNGSVATINGMTVNTVKRAGEHDRGQAAGLVGVMGGGSIKNLTLTNAYVTSDTWFAVGSFVGRQWGANPENFGMERAKTVYENLTSDATLIKTAHSSQIMGAIGGITGVVNDYMTETVFKNCKFTGTITNAGAQCGGIAGYTESGSGAKLYLTNCVVTAPVIKTVAEKAADVKGMGGLIGGSKANIYAENCYVSSTLVNDSILAIYTGGMLGDSIGLGGDMTLSFTDCHFDGVIVSKTYDYNAAFIGASRDVGVKVTFKNCLNTGVLTNSKLTMMIGGMAWMGSMNAPENIGDQPNTSLGNSYTIENAYTAIKAPLINSVIGENVTLVKINGVAATSVQDILAAAPTTVKIADVKGNNAKTAMAGLFGTDTKWVTRNDMYPTLLSASSVADTTYASADYSWFDYSKAGSKAQEIVIDDAAELLALSRMEKACGGKMSFAELISNYKIFVATSLTESVDALFSAENATMLKTGVIPDTSTDDGNDGGEDNGSDNTEDTKAETKADDTTKADDVAVEEDKGCGGVIGGGAVVLVATVGCALAFGKKRKEQ